MAVYAEHTNKIFKTNKSIRYKRNKDSDLQRRINRYKGKKLIIDYEKNTFYIENEEDN
jgi:hypothetical protein